MINATNIVLAIQKRMSSSSNPLELATISKIVEKLDLGAVKYVADFVDLPSTEPDATIYLVGNEDELYYKLGTTWYSLGNINSKPLNGWGFNSSGNIGDGTTLNRDIPTSTLNNTTIDDWVMATGAQFHTLGITYERKQLYAWGTGSTGRLGTDSILTVSSPVLVAGGITGWTDASAGGFNSAGIANGIAYTWGSASDGKLGNNQSTVNASSPVVVTGGITDWLEVSVGSRHCLGITSSGYAYAWGYNAFRGSLGDNTVQDRSSPVLVAGGMTSWSSISAGTAHSLGIAGGIMYAWGTNNNGQLGTNGGSSRSSPVAIAGGITDWKQASAGNDRSIGLTDSGIVYCWGTGAGGANGDGTTIAKSSPVTVLGGITNWTKVSSGEDYHIGLTSSGFIYAWGDNTSGQLGDGSLTARSSPVSIYNDGLPDLWVNIGTGSFTSFGIQSFPKTYPL